jgi:uncharacterized glyoxalase superfamily protein PhnB
MTTSVKPIPDGYHTVTPYLIVQGASDLIAFTRAAFGATERSRNAGPDGLIMHAEVQIGDSVVMLSDASPAFGAMPMMLHLYVADCDAAYRQALAAGAQSVREPADQPYGDRSAGVKDRWGNQWWLATHIKDA